MSDIPEHFPSLSVCINKCKRYERKPVAGPAAKRGSRCHKNIEDVLSNRIELHAVPPSYQSQCAIAKKLVDGAKILLIEKTVVAKVGGFEIPATPDIVLDGDPISVINWKTGQQRDYRMAQRFYALAICQMYGVDRVRIVECYVDSGHETCYTLRRENCARLCEEIVNAYLSRDQYEPARCEWCRFCSKGPTGDGSCKEGCTYGG